MYEGYKFLALLITVLSFDDLSLNTYKYLWKS